jgi:hypothetical protein
MLPRLFNLVEGLLYRSPLRLMEATGDPKIHKLSWDVGYHHAIRGKKSDPNNMFIKDADSYVLGYEAGQHKHTAAKEAEAAQAKTQAQADSAAKAQAGAETHATLLRNTPEQPVWKPEADLTLADVAEEAPSFYSHADKQSYYARETKVNAKRLANLPAAVTEIRENGVLPGSRKGGLVGGSGDKLDQEIKRRAFHSEGRSIVEQDEALSAQWTEASNLSSTLKRLEEHPDTDRSSPQMEELRKRTRVSVNKACAGLRSTISGLAAKHAANYFSEDEFQTMASTFHRRFMGKVALGTMSDMGRWRKTPGAKGRDIETRGHVENYSKNLFQMWGPVATSSLRSLKAVLEIPPFVRAHYSSTRGVATFTDSNSLAHEFGHHMDHTMGASYWSRRVHDRAEGDPTTLFQSTGLSAYGDERGVKDKWGIPYMGKVYSEGGGGSASEVVSMLSQDFGSDSDHVHDIEEGDIHYGDVWPSQFMADRSLLTEFTGYVSSCVKGGMRLERARLDRAKAKAASQVQQ